MRLGLLQCGPIAPEIARDHGDYPDLYARLLGPGFDWTTYRVFEGDHPADPHEQQGWLVSGSRFNVGDGDAWIARTRAFVGEAHDAAVPLVGICFGHQLFAQAMGGRAGPAPQGWTVGRQAYDWGGETIHLNAWHRDQVLDAPGDAEILATHPSAPFAALRMGRTLTVQAHPEFSNDYIAALLPHYAMTVPPERIAAATDALHAPVDNARIGALLAAHLRQDRP